MPSGGGGGGGHRAIKSPSTKKPVCPVGNGIINKVFLEKKQNRHRPVKVRTRPGIVDVPVRARTAFVLADNGG